eukprot:COSAG01_NODE_1067_length_11878_cov_89.529077_11_plen_72_part_00
MPWQPFWRPFGLRFAHLVLSTNTEPRRRGQAGAQGGVWRLQWLGAVGDVAVRPLRTAELEGHMPVPVRRIP